MSNRIRGILSLVILYLIAGTFPAQAQSSDARALLQEAAKAMGGMQALLESVRHAQADQMGSDAIQDLGHRTASPARRWATASKNARGRWPTPRSGPGSISIARCRGGAWRWLGSNRL